MCPRFFIRFPLCSLEEMCGNALLGILEVLDCVEFAGEEFCDVEHREGVSLSNETQEGQLVECVFEVLLVHHDVQLLVERSCVSLAHSLDAEAFAGSKGWVAGLAYLGDGAIFIHHDFHLFFPKFVTNEGEDVFVTVCEDAFDDLSVVEQVAVEQEYLFSVSLWTSQPERINVVGRLVVLVVDEACADAVAISLLDEVLDLLVQVTRHDDELAYASLDECVH